MPTIFWDTTFTACALTAMSLLAFEFSEGPSRKRLLYASVLFSLASLLNSALFFTSVALLVLLSAQLPAARLKSFLLALVVFSITFSPWPIRNAFVMRAFIPFRTTVGLELWMGNHEGATGHLEETLFPLFNAQELAEYKRLGEVGYNHEKAHLALNYIYSEPAAFIRLTLARIARYWLGTGSRDESKWLAIHGILTTAFGFAGIAFFVWKRSTKSVLPFVIPLVMFPLPYYITHAEFRYRLVVDPLMTAFAACAVLLFIQEANKQLSNRSPRAFGATAPMGSRLSNPKMVQLTASNDRERAS
jgi:hypothetical protein